MPLPETYPSLDNKTFSFGVNGRFKLDAIVLEPDT
jgi:hypothetical protein